MKKRVPSLSRQDPLRKRCERVRLLLSLILDGLDGRGSRLRVEVTTALDEGPVILVEFIEQGDPGGDV